MVKYFERTFIVFVMVFWVGCLFNVAAAKTADAAVIEDGVYKNGYFAFTMQIPSGWEILSQETKAELQRVGKEVLVGDDKNLKAAISAAEKNVFQLLSISRYPLGTPGKQNIVFTSGAEKVSALPGIKNGSDYLMNVKALLKFSSMEVHLNKEIYVQKIDGIDFAVLDVSMNINNNEVKQLLYATIIKGYAYYFNYTYITPQDLQFLKQIVSTMKFEKSN